MYFCFSGDEIENFTRIYSESSKLFYFGLNIIDDEKSEVGGVSRINKEGVRGEEEGSAGEQVTIGISRTLDLNSRKSFEIESLSSSSSSSQPYSDRNVIDQRCSSITNTDVDAITKETYKENAGRNINGNKIENIMTHIENNDVTASPKIISEISEISSKNRIGTYIKCKNYTKQTLFILYCILFCFIIFLNSDF